MTTAPAHGERDHATWSASATARNMACAGALALCERAPPDKENPAAAWGTACHQLAERCLRGYLKSPHDAIGSTETTKSHEIVVDEEMADTAAVYVDYVQRSAPSSMYPVWIEERFSLASLKPPFDAGGTCDAVIYSPAYTLEVIDLKGGRGVVEAADNSQLRTYAIGALLAHPDLQVETVTTTIVQPRAPHKDGSIRSQTFHVADLIDWTGDLIMAMRRSHHAMTQLDVLPEMTWAERFLKAGEHCRFCRAAPTCPALKQRALDAAGVFFDDLDQPQIRNDPKLMDGEQLAKTLDLADMIGEWINAVRAHAHAQAERGVSIPGYQLSERIGNRKWLDEAEAYRQLSALGLSEGQLTTSKIKSPAQIEKLLGAKRKSEIEGLTTRDVTGTNLVKVDKTTRPAVAPAAERFFEKMD